MLRLKAAQAVLADWRFDFNGADFGDIFGDIFGDLFGGGRRGSRCEQWPDEEARISRREHPYYI